MDKITGVNKNANSEYEKPPIGPPDPGPPDHETDRITGVMHKTGRIPGVNIIKYGDAFEFKYGYQEIIIKEPGKNSDTIEEVIEEEVECMNLDAVTPSILPLPLPEAPEPTTTIFEQEEGASNYHPVNPLPSEQRTWKISRMQLRKRQKRDYWHLHEYED